ncbi:unnamed protein product [Prorocentrum cordatum]|uniref:Uncharacterized protein n=1 Tax=Prorocentrum cordatum TaxID=2364126 RepID=A0ABN9WMM9_9DINO|nr:unnamed protein product [Polarella glacialis]
MWGSAKSAWVRMETPTRRRQRSRQGGPGADPRSPRGTPKAYVYADVLFFESPRSIPCTSPHGLRIIIVPALSSPGRGLEDVGPRSDAPGIRLFPSAPLWTPEAGTEKMGTMPNDKRCPRSTATAARQAASSIKWTTPAAARTAIPVQNGQELLSVVVHILSVAFRSCRCAGLGGDAGAQESDEEREERMGEEAEEEEEESAATKRPIPFRLLLKSYGPDPTSSEALRPTAAAWGRSETHKLGGRTARRRTTSIKERGGRRDGDGERSGGRRASRYGTHSRPLPVADDAPVLQPASGRGARRRPADGPRRPAE